MPRYSNYFHEEFQTQKLLAAHGFDQWPDELEVIKYLMKVEDKIDALAAALELDIQTDVRGRLNVIPAEPVPIPPKPYWEMM